jgi:hypothetical protein
MRFRDLLMCVLASVRNIFAVCFEGVTSFSVGAALSIRNVYLVRDFAPILKRRRAGNFLWLAPEWAPDGAVR